MADPSWYDTEQAAGTRCAQLASQLKHKLPIVDAQTCAYRQATHAHPACIHCSLFLCRAASRHTQHLPLLGKRLLLQTGNFSNLDSKHRAAYRLGKVEGEVALVLDHVGSPVDPLGTADNCRVVEEDTVIYLNLCQVLQNETGL